MPRSAADTRAHVLDVARELFYWKGIRATGVDLVAAEAEVSATTLYRQFASKDDLVAAYVAREAAGYRRELDLAAAGPGTPRERILGLFAAVADQIARPCRGCPFQMALAELPDEGLPAHRHAVELKAWVHGRLRELAGEHGAADPDELADALALVLEGAYATVGAFGPDGPARRVLATAARLLDATPAGTG